MRLTGLRTLLLRWYDGNGRDLPWRRRGGPADPYRVWLSEIMLQQTLAAAAIPFFRRFLELWPDVEALAAAPRAEVLQAWAGLGYYARARNLHEAAGLIARHGPPRDEAGWRALPGVGAYTAAAIAAIALDQPANVVDGNVERVMARLYAVAAPLPGAKPGLRALAARFVSAERPGDWAQALMDLGATICTPQKPRCGACPAAAFCAAYATGAPAAFPRRTAKPARPRRHGAAFWLTRGDAVLLVRRPDAGLLGGMMALPSTPWRAAAWTASEARAQAPAAADWRRAGAVTHVFTHFALELEVWAAEAQAGEDAGGQWIKTAALAAAGLPTLFRKAAVCAAAPQAPMARRISRRK